MFTLLAARIKSMGFRAGIAFTALRHHIAYSHVSAMRALAYWEQPNCTGGGNGTGRPADGGRAHTKVEVYG